MIFFFFFSSRRRHTRSLCDWSSDVCSSDLMVFLAFEYAVLPSLQRNIESEKNHVTFSCHVSAAGDKRSACELTAQYMCATFGKCRIVAGLRTLITLASTI